MTFPEFVEKARAVRGDRFEYRDDGWSGVSGKVVIVCPDHGEFRASASWHLKGIECPRCSRPRAGMSFSEFVDEASARYEGRYSYPHQVWNGVSGQISFDCPEHGRIVQSCNDHLTKGGCRFCSCREKAELSRFDLERFVAQARHVHGDRYLYEHGLAFNRDRMSITCSVHGIFQQTRAMHLAGHGCHVCAGRVRRTHDQYVTEATLVHSGKYRYDKARFAGMHRKIVVICPIHGDFETQAKGHLSGKGCAACSGVKKKTTSQFVADARARHGDRYDYSLVEYRGARIPVTIICKSHGSFVQKPNYHLSNSIGCHHCTYSVSRPETEWLDSLGIPLAMRQARIFLDGKSRSVDAFDPTTGTVYEFWGSWWHGDPTIFDPTDFHNVAKKTFGELYALTLRKREAILSAGYALVEIWESEFKPLRSRLTVATSYEAIPDRP